MLSAVWVVTTLLLFFVRLHGLKIYILYIYTNQDK